MLTASPGFGEGGRIAFTTGAVAAIDGGMSTLMRGQLGLPRAVMETTTYIILYQYR